MSDVATPALLFGFIVGGVGVATVLALRYRRHADHTRRVLEDDCDSDQCVACHQSDVSELGPQAYCCKGCGFTWGSGLKQLRATAKREAIEAMSTDERRRSGLEDLKQARLLLLAASGSAEAALEASQTDLRGVTNDETADKKDRIARALTQAREAREQVVTAQQKLEGAASNTLAVTDVDVIDFGADHYLFDDFEFNVGGIQVNVGDEKIHAELERLDRAIRDMLASVERALVLTQD